MKKLLLIIFFIYILTSPLQAKTIKDFAPQSTALAKHNFTYYLFCDNQVQGFFTTEQAAYAAINTQKRLKTSRVIQLLQGEKEILSFKQNKITRTAFLPWQVEISPGVSAVYFDISWEGDAEVAFITPNGQRISQSDFGKKYPNIKFYYANQGEDILILNPPPGIWQVWVLGKFKNAQIDIPDFYYLYTAEYKPTRDYQKLTFATYWNNKFFEDQTPARFLLADEKGKLYNMQSYNPRILDELIGYNGVGMEMHKPGKTKWQLILLTMRPEITDVHFTVFTHLQDIEGQITKLKYDAKTRNFLFYWKAEPVVDFPKVLFLSAYPLKNGPLVNLIVPLTKNPQTVPADMLPYAFTYKYYLSSSFGMGDEGLLEGPRIK